MKPKSPPFRDVKMHCIPKLPRQELSELNVCSELAGLKWPSQKDHHLNFYILQKLEAEKLNETKFVFFPI